MSAPDIATPQQRATFLTMLAAVAPGQAVSANLVHDDAHKAAQLPPAALGGLFGGAVRAGYLFPIGFVQATDQAAKGRWIRQYERSTKDVPGFLQAVAS